MRITSQQRKLLPFLQEKERAGMPFSLQELSDATGYPVKQSVKAKISRGEWDPFVRQSDEKELYLAEGTLNLQVEEFAIKVSSKNRRSTNGELSDVTPTASDNLLCSSREEFLLAIELFNRPTAPNRLEAFLTHFIMAFEKLLKARVINELGDEAIWDKDSSKKHTISLRNALNLLYKENDPLRRNLEYIIGLRDWSMHYFLVEELGPTASRYFQSGVFNYCHTYQKVTGRPPLNLGGLGLLSLVIDGEPETVNVLQQKYGIQKAKAILAKIQELENAANIGADIGFAIPLDLRVGLLPKGSVDGYTLENILSGRAIIVNRPRDPKQTHPHRASDVIAEVNRRITRDNTPEQVMAMLTPGRKKAEFNSDDFNSICANEKWQKESNTFHFDHGVQARNTYSNDVVDFILNKLTTQPQYLGRVKKKKANQRKTKGK